MGGAQVANRFYPHYVDYVRTNFFHNIWLSPEAVFTDYPMGTLDNCRGQPVQVQKTRISQAILKDQFCTSRMQRFHARFLGVKILNTKCALFYCASEKGIFGLEKNSQKARVLRLFTMPIN